jgi:hypothetical protein
VSIEEEVRKLRWGMAEAQLAQVVQRLAIVAMQRSGATKPWGRRFWREMSALLDQAGLDRNLSIVAIHRLIEREQPPI